MSKVNKKRVEWEGFKFSHDGIDYIFKPDRPNAKTGELYDAESYQRAKNSDSNPILVGRLLQDPNNPKNLIVDKDVV